MLRLAWCCWLLLCLCPPARAQYLPPYEQANLEKNRNWIAARDQGGQSGDIGIFCDAGVWNTGARSLVTALEGTGLHCRVFLATGLSPTNLKGLKVLILPGGFAPYEWQAAQASGLEAVRGFVQEGGTVLGICAGSYLLARTVRYDGLEYPYPLGLFDGVAEGPVAGLATYPGVGPVTVTPTAAGLKAGMGITEHQSYAYGSGPRFVGGTNIEILATYPDGTAAVIRRACGKGKMVASGVHFERPPTADDDIAPPAEAGAVLRALLGF